MSYKLIIHALPGKNIFEREYRQSLVSIGRDEESDLLLLDPRHRVSRKHAEIRGKGSDFCLVDLGSKNGTKLNEVPLAPGKEYRLKKGYRIVIGTFSVDFIPIAPHLHELPEFHVSAEESQADAVKKREIKDLIAELNRSYCAEIDKKPERWKGTIQEILRRTLSKKSAEEASNLLASIESHYLTPVSKDGSLTGGSPLLGESPKAENLDVCKKAHNGLLKIAMHYIEDCKDLMTVEGIEEFVERLEKVIGVMFDSLAKALKSRRRFEQEFDVDATRLLFWQLNPIKECETGKAIGKHLFDLKKEQVLNKAITDLEEGFGDLALHHLGLIAGLEESLKGILDQLNPELFEIEGEKSAGSFMGLGPIRSRAAWKRYCDKYQELREEEVRTFETILGPYIAKGYLSVQKRKKSH